MSNRVNSPGFCFADSVIASPHLFSRARIFFDLRLRVGAASGFDPRLRVSASSGSERGSINKPFAKSTLATARGTDSEVVRKGRFFLPASRLHVVFVALVHEGGKELRAQGASAQEKSLSC